MTISEQSRHAMYVKLEEALGQEAALILMEHLPPVGWADVATKRDLDHLRMLTRADIDQLGAETREEIAQLRSDLRGEIAQLGSELRGEMAQLGSELRGEMSLFSERMFDRMTAQTRTLVFSVMGSALSVAALTMTAVRIG